MTDINSKLSAELSAAYFATVHGIDKTAKQHGMSHEPQGAWNLCNESKGTNNYQEFAASQLYRLPAL